MNLHKNLLKRTYNLYTSVIYLLLLLHPCLFSLLMAIAGNYLFMAYGTFFPIATWMMKSIKLNSTIRTFATKNRLVILMPSFFSEWNRMIIFMLITTNDKFVA